MAALFVWLHLIAAAVWVGSQIFVGVVAVPAVRAIPDIQLRVTVLQTLTRRYGYVGWVSLAVLGGTGLHRLSRALPDLALLFQGGYGGALFTKLVLGLAILLLTAVHTWFIGPRLLAAMEAGTPTRRLARASLLLSMVNLWLSLWVLWVVATLR
jgi:copper resistance protein D